jgi:competence protein ComEA
VQSSAQQPDPQHPSPRPPKSGLAESVDQTLVWLDSLRDRRGFSTTIAVVLGIGIAMLWSFGRLAQPESIEAEIPSILERSAEETQPPSPVSTPTSAASVAIGPGQAAADAVWGESTTSGAPVVVHVSGAVLYQGLVELPAGARLADAIEAAGGQTALADVHRLNLATPLVDGMHIRVPGQATDEDVSDLPLVELPSSATGAGAESSMIAPGQTGMVNINRADAARLEDLPGVGPTIAAAIVSWRDDNGPFTSVEDLLAVPGIGPAKLAALQDLVTL